MEPVPSALPPCVGSRPRLMSRWRYAPVVGPIPSRVSGSNIVDVGASPRNNVAADTIPRNHGTTEPQNQSPKQIFIFIIHRMGLHEFPILFFEGLLLMVFALVFNISNNRWQLRWTDRKCPVPILPVEFSNHQSILIDPLGRICLQRLEKSWQIHCLWWFNQRMNVIFNPANLDGMNPFLYCDSTNV